MPPHKLRFIAGTWLKGNWHITVADLPYESEIPCRSVCVGPSLSEIVRLPRNSRRASRGEGGSAARVDEWLFFATLLEENKVVHMGRKCKKNVMLQVF